MPSARRVVPKASKPKIGERHRRAGIRRRVETIFRIFKAKVFRTRTVYIKPAVGIEKPEEVIREFRIKHPNVGELLIQNRELAKAHKLFAELTASEREVVAALLIRYGEALFSEPALLKVYLGGPKSKLLALVDALSLYCALNYKPLDMLNDLFYIAKYGLNV